MCHLCSVGVVSASLDLINPVKLRTFTFALNFPLKGKNKSELLAGLADGWMEGEQWQMAMLTGKAFRSYIWWCYWVLPRTAWSSKGACGTDGQQLSKEMEWQRGRQSFKEISLGHGEMRLQLRCSRGPWLWPHKRISERDPGAFLCAQSFVSLSKVILAVKPKPSRSIGTARKLSECLCRDWKYSLDVFLFEEALWR